MCCHPVVFGQGEASSVREVFGRLFPRLRRDRRLSPCSGYPGQDRQFSTCRYGSRCSIRSERFEAKEPYPPVATFPASFRPENKEPPFPRSKLANTPSWKLPDLEIAFVYILFSKNKARIPGDSLKLGFSQRGGIETSAELRF